MRRRFHRGRGRGRGTDGDQQHHRPEILLSTATALVAFIKDGEGGPVKIKNTIVALNTGSAGRDIYGAFASSGFNLIGKIDGSTGFTAPTDQTGTIAAPLDPKIDPAGLRRRRTYRYHRPPDWQSSYRQRDEQRSDGNLNQRSTPRGLLAHHQQICCKRQRRRWH